MHIHWWSWKAQGLGFWEESVKNKASWELVSERKRGSGKVVSSGDSGIEACCCYIKAIIFLFKVFVHIQNHTESHKILIAFYPRQQWKNKRKLCQAAPGKVQVGHKEELDRAVKHWNGLQRRWWSHHPQMYSKKSWMWHLVLWSIWRSGDQSKVGFNDCVIGAKILQLQYDPGRQKWMELNAPGGCPGTCAEAVSAVQTWLSVCSLWAAGISVGKGNWLLVNVALLRASVWDKQVKTWRFFNKSQNPEPLQIVDSSVPDIIKLYISESGQGTFHLNWSYITLPIIKDVWTSQGCWATTCQHSSQSGGSPPCQVLRNGVVGHRIFSQAHESCHHIRKNTILPVTEKIKETKLHV